MYECNYLILAQLLVCGLLVATLPSCKLDDNRVRGDFGSSQPPSSPSPSPSLSVVAKSTEHAFKDETISHTPFAVVIENVESMSQIDILVSSSSNPTLLPTTGITVNCTPNSQGCAGALQIVPEAGQDGTTTVIFLVTSGELTTEFTMELHVIDAVQAVYPNYKDWNQYVNNSNLNLPPYMQTEAVCDNTSTASRICIHGGEMRRVDAVGFDTCLGLTMEDEHQVFHWRCDDSFSPVRFYSLGIKQGKGLRHLINTNSWKTNSVTLKKEGQTIFTTTSNLWWTNTVEPLPNNELGTDSYVSLSGKIYTLASSRATSGYRAELGAADEGALVMFDGAVLTFSGTGTDHCHTDWGHFSTNNASCLLVARAQRFWVEGTMNVQGADFGIIAYNYVNNMYRDITVLNANKSGIRLSRVGYSEYRNISFYNNGGGGGGGLDAFSLKSHIFTNIKSINNDGWGLRFHISDIVGGSGLAPTVITNVLSANNGGDGIYIYDGGDELYNTFIAMTSLNNGGHGVQYNNGTGGQFLSLLDSNNGGNGILSDSLSPGRFANLAVTNNESPGIDVEYDLGTFQGPILVGNNDLGGSNLQCQVDNIISSNLVHNTCSSTGADGSSIPSFGVLRTGKTVVNSVVGKSSSDTTNPHGGTGLFSYGSISIPGWSDFESWFRGWGKEHGDPLLTGNHRGACTSGNCRIWDYSLLSSDTAFLNRSGDGTTANDSFTAGAICPSQIHGNEVLVNSTPTPSQTFLRNAMEIPNDYIGDEDGLCESNETCIYLPNFGAYQGHGDYKSNSCIFQDGTVSGVTMYAFPTNGR